MPTASPARTWTQTSVVWSQKSFHPPRADPSEYDSRYRSSVIAASLVTLEVIRTVDNVIAVMNAPRRIAFRTGPHR